MPSKFDRAIDKVLAHEGGFVNHPDDPGGATNWGISLRWLKKKQSSGEVPVGDLDHDGDVDVDDIRGMSKEQAIDLYRMYFWDPYHYDLIDSQLIATKVFDLTVNMGSVQSHKLLQRACRACGWHIVDDGIIGPKTLDAVNAVDGQRLLAAYRSEAAGFYRLLCCQNERFLSFINGWLNRAYD